MLNLEPAEETAGFSAAKHIELLADHAPKLRLDVVLADSAFASDDPHLVAWADSLGADLAVADLAARDGSPRATTRSGWRRRTPRSWASRSVSCGGPTPRTRWYEPGSRAFRGPPYPLRRSSPRPFRAAGGA